ncbi:hypothetical protein T190607A01A_40297 [Tenacibaculum sp. 190524A05c]|uniref:Late nodulin n=1 Tax=Tenacibaculum platacis TaxID=3137852 RepID=A0ABM9P4W1_9FLAO
MKNSYDKLTTEFIETRKVSPFLKLVSFALVLIFLSTPLSQIVPDFLTCNCYEILPNFKGCILVGNLNCFCF